VVRNFFERTLSRQLDRVATLTQFTPDTLCSIHEEDLPSGEPFDTGANWPAVRYPPDA